VGRDPRRRRLDGEWWEEAPVWESEEDIMSRWKYMVGSEKATVEYSRKSE
jgi:hypothetical protein